MNNRRGFAQLLAKLSGQVDDYAELRVKLAITHGKNRGFQKHPDKPLGEVLQRKLARRGENGILGAPAHGTD